MAKLQDILEGFTGSTAQELDTHIKTKCKELKLKLFLDDGEDNQFVPKARLDAKVAENATLKEQLTTQSAAVEKLNGLTKDNEKAQETISKLQSQNEVLGKTMKNQSLDYAIKSKALELKAMDTTGNDLKAFLDIDKLQVNEDGTVTGLDEALKTLKKDKPYLFNAAESNEGVDVQQPLGGTGTPGKPATSNVFNSKTMKSGEFGASLSGLDAMSMSQPAPQAQPQPQAPTPQYDYFK